MCERETQDTQQWTAANSETPTGKATSPQATHGTRTNPIIPINSINQTNPNNAINPIN
jgi:hypothetical protein